jgi:serine/threonine-protein kinase
MARAVELDPVAWSTLRRLLDEALALPAGDRARWLDHLPHEHASLREPLTRLLAHADEPDAADAGRFSTLPRVDAGPARDDDPPPPPDAGPYRCLRLLGEGGMSSVWLAERTDLLRQRRVALKRPRAAWRSAGLAQRMAQEREILGRHDHPNIARIHDAGVGADGQPWLALELVDGVPIDAWCRERVLDARAIVSLFLQVVAAVAHAHARLVVHRDLKPSNILVTRDGVVRLLDFGIARLVGEAREGEPDLTRDQPAPLTPWYAAPEQLLGQPVTTATDLYALGVVLYELLAGRRPWRPARASAAALEEAILAGEPPKPSAAVDDAVRARVLRDDLDTIVLKALKKTPAERYQGAAELSDDLSNWLHDRPIRARPDTAAYRARKFVARNRVAIGVGSALALSLCAGLAAALWEADVARREAAKSLAIKDYLVGLFENADIERRDTLRRRQESVQALLERGAAALPASLGGEPEVRDELEHTVARLLDQLELFEPAVALRRQRVAQLDPQGAPAAARVEALRELGVSERQHGELPAARASLQRADALCAASRASAGEAACSVVQVELGRLDFGERHLDAALARVEPATRSLRAVAPGRIELADALDLLGLLRYSQNRGDEAVALYEEALGLRRALWGPESVRYAIARFRFGRNLWALRHLARAETELREAWRLVTAAVGPQHVSSARIEVNLGRLTYYLGLRDDGLEHLRSASRVLLAQSDRLDPQDVLETRVALGNALLLDGRLAEAGDELARALALRSTLGAAAMADPTLDQSQARWLLDQGRFDEARATLEAFRERAISTYGEGHPEVAERSLRLAGVWLAQGRLDEASREIDRVLSSHDESPAAWGSVKQKGQLARVAWLLERGRAAEARPLVEAQLAAAAATPRGDQYRDVLFQLQDLAARTAAQDGAPALAAQRYEQAIALLAHVDARHPYLAATRARYASLLVAQGDVAGAQRQLVLARPAFEATPAPGEQFVRPWQAALADVDAARVRMRARRSVPAGADTAT